MEKYVVVVAGGKGLRMGGEIPKQFQLLGDKPVIMHTLECFYRTLPSAQFILVLPQEQHDYWKVLCYDFNFTVPCRVVAGGSSRFASVKNGLALIEDKASLVAIHDGVRPFVARRVIEEGFEKALTHPAVIPVVEVVDTLRQTDGEDSFTVDRKAFKRVQTPQVFQTTVLCKAYEQEESPFFTDDASVVEAMEVPIHLFEGNLENIKLTTPFDWKVAQAIL